MFLGKLPDLIDGNQQDMVELLQLILNLPCET